MPLGAGIRQRLRRPGRNGETPYRIGRLAARSVRFARAVTPRSLPKTETRHSAPGHTLSSAIRTEVPVHRLGPVQAAGAMVVPRDLLPLQSPVAPSVPEGLRPVAPSIPDPFPLRPRP
jgi:hypothetical protein